MANTARPQALPYILHRMIFPPVTGKEMVEPLALPEGTVRMPASLVRDLLSSAFRSMDVPDDHADLVADVLVSADLRGIRSHGVGRMSYFLFRLIRGTINKRPSFRYERGSDTTGLLYGDNAIGIVAASRAMDEAMTMARAHGSGFVAVRDSSHFGYAGYWAERAKRNGFIGISMSNGGRRVAPTFSNESILGTNPLAVTIDGGPEGTDFYLDMATSVVAVGKVETALREGREIPRGWVAEAGAKPVLDNDGVLCYDAPLLPLGGEGDEAGGHKGFGLSLMVELLCGALSGSRLAERIAGASGTSPAAMGHFMGEIAVSGFRALELVQADMAESFEIIRKAGKAAGRDRIFIHGEPEAIAQAENSRVGIPVTPALRAQLERWNSILKLGFDLP
jgi:L-2-hydroxycarboxylate dehydrogenase (NAD+)